MARRRSLRAAALLLGLTSAACAGSDRRPALDRLTPCTSAHGPTDAYCGTLSVFENRVAGAGRRLALNIVLLPAIGSEVQADPLVFLAGGPGQGAAQMATQVRDIFRRVLRTRDILLVDQRGTGASHPLDCRSDGNSLRQLTESDEAFIGRLRACLRGFDADVRFYTTTLAMDDLNDVRAHLGYDRVNLYGGSYGTRAALVYLRRHGRTVRTMTLDGVSPTDMRIPLFTARDAQRALDRLLADCAAEPGCNAAYPGLAARVRALLNRLEQSPPQVRIVHPRTGIAEEVVVEARVAASLLFGALYAPLTASMVPMLVERAEQNDFQPLFALGFATEQAAENMSLGMQLSVLCSEDAPRVSAGDLSRETQGTVFRTHLGAGQQAACAIWPTGDVEASFYEPVAADVPSLILSGDVDPVTPPSWGAEVAAHLPNARHLTVPATGHGVIGTPCGLRLIERFLDSGLASDLDVSCLNEVKRPPFFVTPAGPDPAPAAPSRP